jgi:hypothetical protein
MADVPVVREPAVAMRMSGMAGEAAPCRAATDTAARQAAIEIATANAGARQLAGECRIESRGALYTPDGGPTR